MLQARKKTFSVEIKVLHYVIGQHIVFNNTIVFPLL